MDEGPALCAGPSSFSWTALDGRQIGQRRPGTVDRCRCRWNVESSATVEIVLAETISAQAGIIAHMSTVTETHEVDPPRSSPKICVGCWRGRVHCSTPSRPLRLRECGITPRQHYVLVTARGGDHTQTDLARTVGTRQDDADGDARRARTHRSGRASAASERPARAPGGGDAGRRASARPGRRALQSSRVGVLSLLPDDERAVLPERAEPVGVRPRGRPAGVLRVVDARLSRGS